MKGPVVGEAFLLGRDPRCMASQLKITHRTRALQ